MPELRHVRLWNGLEDQYYARIVWDEGVIRKVDPDTPQSRGDDLSVIPGLIDTHVHLASYAGRDAQDYRTWPLITPITTQVLHAYANARRALAVGVTTVRDMESGWCQISLRDAVNQEVLKGPRVLAFGMVSMTGGHADLFTPAAVQSRPLPTADGPDACRRQVRIYARMGMDGIKIATGGGVLSVGDKPQWRNYTDAENEAIVDEAHALGLPVGAHAHDELSIDAALRAGVDSLEHGTLITEAQARVVAARPMTVAPTLLINDRIANGDTVVPAAIQTKAQDLVRRRDQQLRQAVQRGVRCVLGTDSSGLLMPFGLQWHELTAMQNVLGLSSEETLRAATSQAATTIGLGDRLGQVRPGYAADFVLMRGMAWLDLHESCAEQIVAVVASGNVTVGHLPE